MVIGVGSVGVDMVDVAAATAAGIVVTNVPDVFIEEVADHAMMLLLDVARMTPLMAAHGPRGRVVPGPAASSSRRPACSGQTLGLYAFGNVARCTARRAKAFGLRVIAYDPYVSELEITGAGVEPVGFGELLERSDFLSIHAPHNAETEHAIDAAALSRMKPTAVVINTARGPIIDEQALIEALRDGVIAGAGLDVLEREPRAAGQPAAHHGQCGGDAARGLGHHPDAAGDPPPRRPRGGPGAARPLADELCQSDRAAARRCSNGGSPTR